MTDLAETVKRLRELAEKATPGPWQSRGLGGDSILLAPTHKWNKPYIIPEHGYPLALPRTYETAREDGSPETRVDFSSAGFAHDDARYIAAANPAAISSILDALEGLERERDGYKQAAGELDERLTQRARERLEFKARAEKAEAELAAVTTERRTPGTVEVCELCQRGVRYQDACNWDTCPKHPTPSQGTTAEKEGE